MKTIIFITGKPRTGKTLLACKVRNSREVHSLEEATLAASKRPLFASDVVENIVFTSNEVDRYGEIRSALRELSEKHNRSYMEVIMKDPKQ